MRKLISVILAVLMVVSVTAVSFSAVTADTAAVAAGTATVTMVGFRGETVTKTYAVGETLTAYLYLNANEAIMALDSTGKYGVSSIKAQQEYDSDILEIADVYGEDGVPSDLVAMMPIMGNSNAVANLKNAGYVYYNASKPQTSGLKFISDTSALLVTHYTVKAAGAVTIDNKVETLALSDTALTRLVTKFTVVNDGFCSPVALSEPEAPSGFTVSGTIASFINGTDALTATLSNNDNTFALTPEQTIVEEDEGFVKTEAVVAFENVPAGTYTLSIEKKNHVTRDYEVEVTDQDVSLDEWEEECMICPIGDINNDGDVTMRDYAKAYKCAQELDSVDGYKLLCGDVAGDHDGEILMKDYAKIYKHVQELTSLWT